MNSILEKLAKRLLRFILTIALLIYSASLSAQQFKTTNIDTFFLENAYRLRVIPSTSPALLLYENQPNFNTEFRLQGDIYFIDSISKNTTAYYVFGAKSPDALFAAGYNSDKKSIEFLSVEIDSMEQITTSVISHKNVEIIDHRMQNVYRILFYAKNDSARVEVNGVPFNINIGFSVRSLNRFGYLLTNSNTVVFRPQKIELK